MDCEEINRQAYGVFSKRIHEKAGAKRIPISGSIDLTSRCNLKCVHCYIQGTSLKNEHELSQDEVFGILDQIAEEGCLWLLITGGEPLLRADFCDIYHYAKRKGFIITLFTNGTLVTPQIADIFKEEPPFCIEVSLYGMTADTYERITGTPGSFQRCMQGIRLLHERNLSLQLKTMAMRLNYHELNAMKVFAQSLGTKFKYDPMINVCLDAAITPTRLRLSPEEIVELDLADEDRSRELRGFCDKFWGAPNNDRLYTCAAGQFSFHIASNGDLAECVVARRLRYNLLRGSFREGFYVRMASLLESRRTRYCECQQCALISLCGCCSALAELENGDPDRKVEWYCEIAHRRAVAFKSDWAGSAVTQ